MVSDEPAGESPNQVENEGARDDSRKVAQRPPEGSFDRGGLLPELIARIVQSPRVEQQRRGRDNDGQENVKGKLPELGFWDEQPHRKQSRQDRVHEKLHQP
jgi:hypothetical protein